MNDENQKHEEKKPKNVEKLKITNFPYEDRTFIAKW